MMNIRSPLAGLLAALLVAGSAGAAQAASPCADRYMKMVIPQPAGGVGDIVGRIIGNKVTEILAQPIVYENRPGATTTIGNAAVAASKPDGCTVLEFTISGLVAGLIRDDLPYSADRDLQPIVGSGSFPLTLAVNTQSNIRTYEEFVTTVRSGKGLNFGTGGTGTLAHLTSARLLREVGGNGLHVPFRGNAYAIQSLLANDVQFMFPTTAEALPLSQSGRIRVLAVTSKERMAGFPDVPTMTELGLKDFTPAVWYVFMVPSATPANTVSRLYEAYAQALNDAAVSKQLTALGYSPETRNPADAKAYVRQEAARWLKVVRDNNITSLE